MTELRFRPTLHAPERETSTESNGKAESTIKSLSTSTIKSRIIGLFKFKTPVKWLNVIMMSVLHCGALYGMYLAVVRAQILTMLFWYTYGLMGGEWTRNSGCCAKRLCCGFVSPTFSDGHHSWSSPTMGPQILQGKTALADSVSFLQFDSTAKWSMDLVTRSSSAPQVLRHGRWSTQLATRTLLLAHGLASVQETCRRDNQRQGSGHVRPGQGPGHCIPTQILRPLSHIHLFCVAHTGASLSVAGKLLGGLLRLWPVPILLQLALVS